MNIQEYVFKIDKRIRIFVGFIILIALSYFLYNILIVPLIVQQKSLRLKLGSQKMLLNARNATIKKIDILERELNKAKGQLEGIEGEFLTEDQLPIFFAELRRLLDENNIETIDLAVSEKKPLPQDFRIKGYKHMLVPVDMSLNGNYLDTIVFLSQLKKKEVLFAITRISMNAGESVGKTVDTDLELILYLAY